MNFGIGESPILSFNLVKKKLVCIINKPFF